MIVDSFDVIKRPLLGCRGCGKMLRGGKDSDSIVVLEYTPTSTIIFLCPGCANSRITLDHLAERYAENIDREDVVDVDRENVDI